MEPTNKKRRVITCNHCNEEIEDLYYNVPITETEVGTAFITNGTIDPNGSIRDMIYEHESSDSYDSDWSETPSYECPSCGESIDSMEDITITMEDVEVTEETKQPLPEDFEELNFQIISPQKSKIFTNESPKGIRNNIIICPDCNTILQDTEGNNSYMDYEHEGYMECKCGKVIDMKQYYEKIKQR